MKPGRHPANHSPVPAALRDDLADDSRVARETHLPQVVPEDYHRLCARSFFFADERTAQFRRDAEDRKEIRRDALDLDLFRLAAARQVDPRVPAGGDLLK